MGNASKSHLPDAMVMPDFLARQACVPLFLIPLVAYREFQGGATLPSFKHEFAFRCSFIGLSCNREVVFRNVATQTYLQCGVGGPFPDDLKSPEPHQSLTLSLTRNSSQVSSRRMNNRCPMGGTAQTQDCSRDPRYEGASLLGSHAPVLFHCQPWCGDIMELQGVALGVG